MFLRGIIGKKYAVSSLNIVSLIMLSYEKAYGFALNYISPKASEREKYYNKLYAISSK